MATTKPGCDVRTVSRRDFLLMSGAAAGVSALYLAPGESAGADASKKGGTLRVGFSIEAATMDPHFSGSKIVLGQHDQAGRGYLQQAPWNVFGAGAALFVTVVGLSFVGDAVRDALDPRTRE